jgi:hypothetical protein
MGASAHRNCRSPAIGEVAAWPGLGAKSFDGAFHDDFAMFVVDEHVR